ncbi:MAG: hypothetical protein AAGD07_22330 [Planctomycetota bacterium]
MNIKQFSFHRNVAVMLLAGMPVMLSVGCEKSNSVVEAASEDELNKTEAELSGVTEEEYEKFMNEL